jgi:PAS domain S-box-containing protein
MLNSIRYRLLTWFIFFMLLTIGLVVPVNLIFRSKEKKITAVSAEINALHIDFLRDNRFVNDFLTIEPENSDFFLRGESSFIAAHRLISGNLTSHLLTFCMSDQAHVFNIKDQLLQISEDYSNYNSTFDSLVYLVYKRGHRNFGLKGELTDYANQIQETPGLLSNDILLLKSIENEYFFHADTTSVNAFRQIFARINTTIADSRVPAPKKALHLELINNYGNAFLRLAEIDRKIGIARNSAQRASLNKIALNIENVFAGLYSTTQNAQQSLIARLKFWYFISILFILGIAVYFSYRASRHVVSHLEALSNYISSLAKDNQQISPPIDLQNSTKEIRHIYREFRNLLSQLKLWENQRNSALQHADENHQRYRELSDLLPQSVFETDSYGNYTYVNKAWYHAFGYTIIELNDGLNLIETLVSESNSQDILGFTKIENSTFLAVRKNGTRFPASVYSDNIIKNGKVTGRRGIIIDITERVDYIKSLQQETHKAKTSDELKSSFLANMSHEIRTPMNSIIGFSNLLASEQVPETQKKDFTHYIQTSSEILLNLVDDIIDIAKIEAGELKIVKKDCDLDALGSELLTTSLETRKKLNKKHIQLNFVKDADNPDIYLKTDPFRLRQILINLINNAIKFTEKGSVDFGYTVKDETLIEFYVKDTGPGLSREDLDMIFERFKRARRSEEKNIVGTGLGLAISRNLVQLLGGEMWVNSAAGTGTTFLFTLPYLRTTVLSPGTDCLYHTSENYNWQGKKILIVEDDHNSFSFLHELFRKTGIAITHASNGKEAVEMFCSDQSINIILMDIQLPLMDGLEATRLIKEVRNDIPVIAQTAYAMAGDKEKMKVAGCDDYIPKPLNSSQLLAVLNHFLYKASQPVQENPSASSPIITDQSRF